MILLLLLLVHPAPPANYNGTQLAAEISVRLSTLMFFGSPLEPTVSYDPQTQVISASIADHGCKVMTDTELKTISNWVGTAYDVNNLHFVNELLTNTDNVSTIGTTATPVQFYTNLQSIRNIYMRSPNISSFSTIGANGESSIIKKIPVTSNFGDMIFNNITSSSDFGDCSKQAWKTLEFHY